MSSPWSRAVPGLRAFAGYRRSWLRADLLAGATLWAMLVPQSLGFATLAGLPPVVGLYAAIGAMLTYLWWGSSRVLSVGAESTVALMVATTLTAHAAPGTEEYADLAMVLALLVGLFLVIGGVLGLGRAADFLSRPVLAGYVFGSGVLIVTSQLEGFFGSSVDPTPYLTEVGAVLRNLDEADLTAVGFGVASLVLVLAFRRWLPAVPGALLAVAGSIAVVALLDVDVAVVGAFDGGLPAIGLPDLGWSDVGMLVAPALAIALLVYPDSALTARSLTVGTPDRIDADREFFGIGAANLGAGLLGGFPVNGSQSRSFVLRDAGARSQVANLVAAALAVVTLIALAPIFDYLPTATLAAIVIVAGLSLFDVAEFRAFWRYRRSEFWTAVATVAAVLGLGMLVGIAVAIGLTMLLMVLRAADARGRCWGSCPAPTPTATSRTTPTRSPSRGCCSTGSTRPSSSPTPAGCATTCWRSRPSRGRAAWCSTWRPPTTSTPPRSRSCTSCSTSWTGARSPSSWPACAPRCTRCCGSAVSRSGSTAGGCTSRWTTRSRRSGRAGTDPGDTAHRRPRPGYGSDAPARPRAPPGPRQEIVRWIMPTPRRGACGSGRAPSPVETSTGRWRWRPPWTSRGRGAATRRCCGRPSPRWDRSTSSSRAPSNPTSTPWRSWARPAPSRRRAPPSASSPPRVRACG
nr:SulP family inorganic anion transporter [Nocardioides sambongensis]